MITNKLRFVETDGEPSKATLRKYAKDRRAQNENRDVKEALLIENTLALLKKLCGETTGAGTRRNVFLYLSYSSEAPTDGLTEALKENGFTAFCPRVEGRELQVVPLGEDLMLNERGIREPVGEETDEEMHFAIVPLLAVDRQGNRLGYGGGYYDRYFAKYKSTVRIGYCYDFQIMQSVPHTETDVPLEYIVTDKQVVYTDGKIRK